MDIFYIITNKNPPHESRGGFRPKLTTTLLIEQLPSG